MVSPENIRLRDLPVDLSTRSDPFRFRGDRRLLSAVLLSSWFSMCVCEVEVIVGNGVLFRDVLEKSMVWVWGFCAV